MSLSTHVLDIVHGRPAAGMAITLLRAGAVIFEGVTTPDGRCPALRELDLPPGAYRLTFALAAYFRAQGTALPDPPFLDVVPIDFAMADETHYHVPLLASPFAYSTYRGS